MKKGDIVNFKVIDVNGNDFEFDKSKKVVVISTYPKLNTKVCDEQTVNIQRLANQYPNVDFMSISNDDIKTIESWCGNHGFENAKIYSDKKYSEFAKFSKWRMPLVHVFNRGLIIVCEGKIFEILNKNDMTKQVDFEKLEEILKTI